MAPVPLWTSQHNEHNGDVCKVREDIHVWRDDESLGCVAASGSPDTTQEHGASNDDLLAMHVTIITFSFSQRSRTF